jgi:hypothetical protein
VQIFGGVQHLVEQHAVDAAPHAAQLEWRRVPQLGDGEDAGAVKPLLHAANDEYADVEAAGKFMQRSALRAASDVVVGAA